MIEKLLWKIPMYRRLKVIDIVEEGKKQLADLPYDEMMTGGKNTFDHTFREDISEAKTYYLKQDRLMSVVNKYEQAERFMKKYPHIKDSRVIALAGRLYADFAAGAMIVDGAPNDLSWTYYKLNFYANRWTKLLFQIDPILSKTFYESVKAKPDQYHPKTL